MAAALAVAEGWLVAAAVEVGAATLTTGLEVDCSPVGWGAGSGGLLGLVVQLALATARVAIATKSTEFLPLSQGVTTLTCSLPWCAFGFAIWDPPIFVPNVLGIVFGVYTIAVYACLKRQSRDSAQVQTEATLTTRLRDSERR